MEFLNDFIIEHLKKGNYEESLKLFKEKNEKMNEKCSTKVCEKFKNFLKDRENENEIEDNEDTKKINIQSSEKTTQTSTRSSEKATQTKTLPQLLKSKKCTIGKLIETSRTGFQIDVILELNI